MFKQILIGLGAALVLSLPFSACSSLTDATVNCHGVSNDISSIKGDTVVTTSGLRYIELAVGSGATVQSCQTTTVQYDAFLTNGTKAETAAFTFFPGRGDRIEGLEQGVIGMKTGGRRRLIVPPNLAYGDRGTTIIGTGVTIPPNATVIYDVTIVQAGI